MKVIVETVIGTVKILTSKSNMNLPKRKPAIYPIKVLRRIIQKSRKLEAENTVPEIHSQSIRGVYQKVIG